MRLFVAVYPPADALAQFGALVAGLAVAAPRGPGRSVRFVPPERWHLTMAFLGDVPAERDPAVRVALAAAVARWTGNGAPAAPRLRLGGGGRFGRGASTAMWTGIRGDITGLTDLARDVRRELRAARLPFDAKGFRPHLTLARPGDRLPLAELDADLAALNAYDGPEWSVEAVELVRSQLGPQPHHDRLARFPLGGPGRPGP